MTARRVLLALLLLLAFASGAAGCPTGTDDSCSGPAHGAPASGMGGDLAISSVTDFATLERGARLSPIPLADAGDATPSASPSSPASGQTCPSPPVRLSARYLEHCVFRC